MNQPTIGIAARMLSKIMLISVINPRTISKTKYSSGQRLMESIVYDQKAANAL
jgi:hypothetical protein